VSSALKLYKSRPNNPSPSFYIIIKRYHCNHDRSTCKSLHQYLFPASFLEVGIPPSKNTQPPPPETAAKLCGLNLFFGRDSELQIYHGNLLLMDNKHRKLFVIKQSKGSNFMPQIYQNTFTGRTRSPDGGTSAGFWLGAKKSLKI